MRSISTSPFAFNVAPVWTRSTMCRHRPEARRQLDRAVELDALGLDAARGEMAAGDLGIFGRDPDVARPRVVLARDPIGGRRDRDTAMADLEIERRVDLGIIEFHQHVVAGDAELRRAERDKGRDVEAAHPDDVETGVAGGEAQLARIRIVEGRLGLDADARATAASPRSGCGRWATP